MATPITAIPTASQLQQQLDMLYKAIDMLETDGTTIPNMTVTPAPSNDPTQPYTMPFSLVLNPAISNPATLDKLKANLEARTEDVKSQLVAMGYTDDTRRPQKPPM
jgi:hypothetical protein